MSKNKDGLAKNIEVVKDEFLNWYEDQTWNVQRLRRGQDNVFHLGVAFISTTFQALPRTLTYLTLVGAAIYVVSLLI